MKNYSLWLENVECIELDPLNEDRKVDVVIVGGGITGLSTLYQLKESDKDVILVEANLCGMGVTSKSTAKVTTLQEDLYMKIRKYDKDMAALYLKSQIYARDLLLATVNNSKIDCDLKRSTSYTFTKDLNKEKDIKEENDFLNFYGLESKTIYEVPFREECASAVKMSDAYVFHPLKYINALKNLFKEKIYEHSRVEKIIKDEDGFILSVNGHSIKTKSVIVATHYPYFFKSFFLPLKSHIEVSFVGAREAKYENYNAINIDKPTISMRYHKSGRKSFKIHIYDSLKSSEVDNIENHFENLVSADPCDYVWSNNDIMTNDSIPFIGSVKEGDDTFLIGTGYNTWGMTNGTLAGKILADIVEGRENPYRDLMNPNRRVNFGKLVSFPIDVMSNIKSFLKGGKGNVNNDNVEYDIIDGIEVAIVKDENGVKHTVLAKCPHMKCGLIFNKVENTWDCMCHGSRFDIDGNVIEGPSNKDIKFKY